MRKCRAVIWKIRCDSPLSEQSASGCRTNRAGCGSLDCGETQKAEKYERLKSKKVRKIRKDENQSDNKYEEGFTYMIADCHMHTEFSTDSETRVEDQVEQAIRLGMDHICITDHMDMDYPGGEFQLDTDRYVEKILQVKEQYKDKIDISLGVEVGLQEHLKDRINQYIASYPFDFVIGSMHLIYGEDPYYKKIFNSIGDEAAYREYFRATLANLKDAPDIQTLGHLDYVVRYGLEKEKEYSYAKFSQEIDEILKCLIEKEIALEVNTAGIRILSFTNPHPDVIRRYRELGGEMITIGSDGHTPDVLGYGFSEIPELVKSCGFRYYTVFHEKKPNFMKL